MENTNRDVYPILGQLVKRWDGQASLAIGRKGKGTMKLSLEEKIEYVLQYNRGDVIKTPDGAKCRSSFMSSLCEWVNRYNGEGNFRGCHRKTGAGSIPMRMKIR